MLLCDHPSLSLYVCMHFYSACRLRGSCFRLVRPRSRSRILKEVRGTPGSVWGRSGGKWDFRPFHTDSEATSVLYLLCSLWSRKNGCWMKWMNKNFYRTVFIFAFVWKAIWLGQWAIYRVCCRTTFPELSKCANAHRVRSSIRSELSAVCSILLIYYNYRDSTSHPAVVEGLLRYT